MLMNEERLLRLWGKTDKSDPENYHPLLFHLLDVGHVARLLWFQALSPQSRRRIAEALGLTEEDAMKLVTLLAAQHDLGKASAFQRKDAGLWRRLNADSFDIVNPVDKPHGYVSVQALKNLAEAGIGGWKADFEVAYALVKITGGHHGTFPTSADLHDIHGRTLGVNDWETARQSLLEMLAQALFPGETLNQNPIVCPLEELADAALLPLVGGLISISDWVGSSSKFPPTSRSSLADYVEVSQQQAKDALSEFGWTNAPVFAASSEFGEIFKGSDGPPFSPNTMQRKTVEWADAANEPYLLIIEAAMGEGKTEAALYAVNRALSSGFARGFYVALPTQATSNAMFERVEKYLMDSRHGGKLDLQLVHAGALLSEKFEKLLEKARIYDDTIDAEVSADIAGQAGRVVAEGWFTARKRPLLARFGVGTIDQSLMGVLQTRHWFVRLLGLAGKVVVFDEVHAYDVYMGSLLCRLLSWLRALDCTVILLSATLPASSRAALTAAWGNPVPPGQAEYPRITLCRAEAPPEVVSVADPGAIRQTALEKAVLGWANPDWESVLIRLRCDLPDGGCGLLLCNTVTRAQDAFRTLGPRLKSDGWDVRLFHARTLAAWRQEGEKEVLKTFGKESLKENSNRRGRKVLLIATQIVEQSLDLDFDWIASEMAPADLLLQRMGRLWRHPGRDRSPTLAHFVILCEQGADGFPVFPEFTEVIYNRYVLLRSWLALQDCGGSLTLPGDIDPLVQAVYGGIAPLCLSPAWWQELDKSLDKKEQKQKDDERKAEAVLVTGPEKGPEGMLEIGSTLDAVRRKLWDDDDPRVHETVRAATRLGDPSVGVICVGTDENGRSLASPPAGEPTLAETRAMLGFGLPLSRPKPLFDLLVKGKVPASWKNSSLLRYQRTIEFTNGEKIVGEYHLRLSRTEGLVIEKQGRGAEEYSTG